MDFDCGSPCMPPNQPDPQKWFSDNIVLIIIVLAVLYGIGYFVAKAAVKNGILEALKDPDCPLNGQMMGPCGL